MQLSKCLAILMASLILQVRKCGCLIRLQSHWQTPKTWGQRTKHCWCLNTPPKTNTGFNEILTPSKYEQFTILVSSGKSWNRHPIYGFNCEDGYIFSTLQNNLINKIAVYSAKKLMQNPCPVLFIEAIDQSSFSLSRNKGNSRKRIRFHKYTI